MIIDDNQILFAKGKSLFSLFGLAVFAVFSGCQPVVNPVSPLVNEPTLPVVTAQVLTPTSTVESLVNAAPTIAPTLTVAPVFEKPHLVMFWSAY